MLLEIEGDEQQVGVFLGFGLPPEVSKAVWWRADGAAEGLARAIAGLKT